MGERFYTRSMQLGLNASSTGISAFFAWDFASRRQAQQPGAAPARVIDVKPVARRQSEDAAPQQPERPAALVVEAGTRVLSYAPGRAGQAAPQLQQMPVARGQFVDTFA